ncbi:hypothetical protein UA08_02380 [Talaromyces atroroseus]|uniref:Uncharacterized protein n=1 Tax=Talaromyces atroroseus TaxID=1441469 RepID=A0A225AZ20_TALAT|nr:hypothetical protein UA08_02380 [Talaromyces atroroseus]OKL62598.1 hypothetical protein UA08_02380 [Talaromyces atroroseus]
MSAAEVSIVTAAVATPEDNARGNTGSRGRGRRGRGHHRGRGRGGHNRSQGRDGIEEAPAPILPDATGIQNLAQSSTQQTPSGQPQRRAQSNRHPKQTQDTARGGHTHQGRRGNRSSRVRANRTANNNGHDRISPQVGGRSFGGRLTRNDEDAIENPSPSLATTHDDPLHADAPEFVPGQSPSHGLDSKTGSQLVKKQARKPPAKITTKSTAPDLATRTHEDIANAVSRSGRRTKDRLFSSVKQKMAQKLSDSGAVLDAICHRIFFQQHTHVGVKRRLTLVLYLEYLPTRADKLALVLARAAPILAIQPATQVLVYPVPLWDPHRTVFAERTQQQRGVSTLITHMAGAAGKYAVIYCLVGSTLVPFHVMKGSAVHAKRKSMLVVTVGKPKMRFYAVLLKRKLRVNYMTQRLQTLPATQRHG